MCIINHRGGQKFTQISTMHEKHSYFIVKPEKYIFT
jgi:hypothetical protein